MYRQSAPKTKTQHVMTVVLTKSTSKKARPRGKGRERDQVFFFPKILEKADFTVDPSLFHGRDMEREERAKRHNERRVGLPSPR